MMILNLAPPIERPSLFVQDMSQVKGTLVKKAGPSIYWPDSYSPSLGVQWHYDEWVATTGYDNIPDADPHDPARGFRAPPCNQSCYLLGGRSLAACLASCRRK
jgi:hypothetical protein